MINEFEKEKVFWTRKMNVKLVKFMESRPIIWNPKHPKYTSVEARDNTYSEFAAKCGNEFTGQAVRERWTNIRSTFANYLRKVNRAKLVGQEYNVTWHLWGACQFLKQVNRNVKRLTSKEDYEDINNANDTLSTYSFDQNWSEEENTVENDDYTNNSSCKTFTDDLVEIFKYTQNDAFGLNNTRNGKIGRLVAKKLSKMNSYEACQLSSKIMDILLIYHENNPMNPNNVVKDSDL